MFKREAKYLFILALIAVIIALLIFGIRYWVSKKIRETTGNLPPAIATIGLISERG